MTNTSKEVVNFDPNLNYCGRMATKTIRLVFGTWRYRKEFGVEVGGNCSGLHNIDSAIERVFDDLPEDAYGMPSMTMIDPEGNELKCSDDESQEYDWLKDMLVAAEIVSIQPTETEPKK